MKKIIKISFVLLISLFMFGCTNNSTKQTDTKTTNTIDTNKITTEKKYYSGILKSINSGISWTEKTYVETNTKGKLVTIGDSFIYDIKTSPTNNKTIVAATRNNGLYISYNQGEQWQPLFNKIGVDVKNFSFSKASPKTFYVAHNNKVYKTINAGIDWEVIYIDKDSDIAKVYNDPEFTENVYIIMADGRMIKKHSNGLSQLFSISESMPVKDVYFYDSTAEIFYVLFQNDALYRTDDYGENFVKITALPTSPSITTTTTNSLDSINTLNRSTTSKSAISVVRFLKLFPKDTNSFILSTNNGLYVTNDKGLTFTEMPLLTVDKKLTAFAISPKSPNIFYYSINELLYKTVDYGESWNVVETPTNRIISAINIDPQNNEIIYIGIDISESLATKSDTNLFCDLFGSIFPVSCK